MTEMLTAALAFAAAGLPVFPVNTSKRPLTSHSFYDATTDPAKIKAFWTRYPNAMIAMPTGAVSGISVLDIDTELEHGVDGFQHVPGWQSLSPIIAQTPTGGRHIWFRANGPLGKSTVAGVDVKADGGYVVLAGSWRSDISAGYSFEKGDITDIALLPPFPVDLAERLCRRIDDHEHIPSSSPEADPKLIAAALAAIPNDDVGWEEWTRVGLATWAATSGGGFEAFDAWSAKSSNTIRDGQRTDGARSVGVLPRPSARAQSSSSLHRRSPIGAMRMIPRSKRTSPIMHG
jgi:hypothetical protein